MRTSDPSGTATEPEEDLRLPWSRSDRPVPRYLIRPLQSFLEAEVASGVVLLIALVVALVWANAGPLHHTYEDLWRSSVDVTIGRWRVTGVLRGWIRDGLMALFFLVAGLEIKRELLTGELRDRRAAVLPVLAAVGGMVVPALLFLAVNTHAPASRGWGAAMPTDIALSLGVLALGMPNAPSGLRVLLLSLAIADDLGTIAVVTLFYSQHISWGSVLVAAALGAVVGIAGRVGVRSSIVFLGLGVGMWTALHDSGVSPTLAGVALGFLTPAVPFQRPRAVSKEAHRIADATVDDPEPPDADATEWLALARVSRQAVSPLARLESLLHPWTSYLVVPLFVLSNAGVSVSRHVLAGGAADRVAIGIVLARVIGKPLGIIAAGSALIRLGVGRLPPRVTPRQVIGAAIAAGAPFSVSLFVAELAFVGPAFLDAVRVGIVIAASLSGVVGWLVLRGARPGPLPDAVGAAPV